MSEWRPIEFAFFFGAPEKKRGGQKRNWSCEPRWGFIELMHFLRRRVFDVPDSIIIRSALVWGGGHPPHLEQTSPDHIGFRLTDIQKVKLTASAMADERALRRAQDLSIYESGRPGLQMPPTPIWVGSQMIERVDWNVARSHGAAQRALDLLFLPPPTISFESWKAEIAALLHRAWHPEVTPRLFTGVSAIPDILTRVRLMGRITGRNQA